ncbi:MAG: nitroreductase family protein [Polyangiales bacterium]
MAAQQPNQPYDLEEAIEHRRAFRALLGPAIDDATTSKLAQAARLSPSANNAQPWRFVFVRDPQVLESFSTHNALPDFNQWAYRGSMFVVVCGSQADDATVKVAHRSFTTAPDGSKILLERPLFLFDIGIATGFMMLMATELGLVAHPIAGFDEARVKQLLAIPDPEQVVAMLIVGVKNPDPEAIDELPKDLRQDERRRPPRKPVESFAFRDRYGAPL